MHKQSISRSASPTTCPPPPNHTATTFRAPEERGQTMRPVILTIDHGGRVERLSTPQGHSSPQPLPHVRLILQSAIRSDGRRTCAATLIKSHGAISLGPVAQRSLRIFHDPRAENRTGTTSANNMPRLGVVHGKVIGEVAAATNSTGRVAPSCEWRNWRSERYAPPLSSGRVTSALFHNLSSRARVSNWSVDQSASLPSATPRTNELLDIPRRDEFILNITASSRWDSTRKDATGAR